MFVFLTVLSEVLWPIISGVFSPNPNNLFSWFAPKTAATVTTQTTSPPPYQHNWWHLSIRKLRDLDDLTRKILSMSDAWSVVCGVCSHSVSGGEELQLGTEATQSAEPCWSSHHPQPSLHHHQDICQHNVTMKYYSDCGHVVTSAQYRHQYFSMKFTVECECV